MYKSKYIFGDMLKDVEIKVLKSIEKRCRTETKAGIYGSNPIEYAVVIDSHINMFPISFNILVKIFYTCFYNNTCITISSYHTT